MMYKLNLVPRSIKQEMIYKRNKTILLIIASIMLLTCLFAIKLLHNKVSKTEEALLDKIQESNINFVDLRDFEAVEKFYTKQLERVIAFDEVKKGQVKWSTLISKIFSLKPEDVEILSIKADEDGFYIVEGFSTNSSSIANMVDKFQKFSYDVKLEYIKLDEPFYFFKIISKNTEDDKLEQQADYKAFN